MKYKLSVTLLLAFMIVNGQPEHRGNATIGDYKSGNYEIHEQDSCFGRVLVKGQWNHTFKAIKVHTDKILYYGDHKYDHAETVYLDEYFILIEGRIGSVKKEDVISFLINRKRQP